MPPQPQQPQLYAAVDIGGTKIAAALVDGEGTLLTRAELPTPPRGSAEDVMAVVAKLVDTVAQNPRWPHAVGIGIGSAGPIDPTLGTVSPVNIPGWRDFPLVDHVRQLDNVPGEILLLGDGNAMAAGEHWRGAARGYDNALCLVVSTGVGAGLILDGRLRTGPSGNAGHLGHISVDVEGEPCPCGGRGCLEIIASGTSIARWAVLNGWTAEKPPAAAPSDNVVETNFPALHPHLPPTAADIAASARTGDKTALAAFERAGRALAAGIAATAMLTDIRAAVIGGGVAKAGPLLFDPLRRHLTTYASLPFTRDLAILPATLGADAGLIGAASALAALMGE
jgi:glucokinase